jgi:L-rhamnose mutarotase
MMRVGLHTRLKPGAEERYERYHAAVWPEIRAGMRAVGVTKWVIFRDGLDLFHYVECDDYDRAMAELAKSPIDQRWQAEMAPMMAVAHDLSGSGSDKLRVIFEL